MPKASPGQPLRIPAAEYNLMLDAAGDYQRRLFNQGAEGGDLHASPGLVLVRNQSGADREQFAVLAISGVLIAPSENEREFRSRVAFAAGAPVEGDESHFVILQEPLKSGRVGRALICGVTPVKLNVVNADDQYASAKAGQTGSLETAAVGAARILYKEPGTGLKWGVVLFPAALPIVEQEVVVDVECNPDGTLTKTFKTLKLAGKVS